MNREGTERTTKTFEVEVVQRLEGGNLPPGSLRPTYDGIALLAPAPPAEMVTADTLFHCVPNSFIIKFRQGSGVRVRGGGLVIAPAASWDPPRKDALQQVQDSLASARDHALLRMEWWNNPEHKAEAARIEGIIGDGQQVPDSLLLALAVCGSQQGVHCSVLLGAPHYDSACADAELAAYQCLGTTPQRSTSLSVGSPDAGTSVAIECTQYAAQCVSTAGSSFTCSCEYGAHTGSSWTSSECLDERQIATHCE